MKHFCFYFENLDFDVLLFKDPNSSGKILDLIKIFELINPNFESKILTPV